MIVGDTAQSLLGWSKSDAASYVSTANDMGSIDQ
jgi:hypothetical protein